MKGHIKGGEEQSQTLSLHQSDAREWRNIRECFSGAGLQEWMDVGQGWQGWAVCICDGFSREKKNRNFALRLRCPQLFKSKLSEWNGMKQRLLLNGKNKWNFIFQKKWPQCICTIRESGDDDWNEEGATLGCGHLSSHKKWTQFHLLFKIADVFCNIHHWGTLKLSTLVAKYWVSWVGTVLFRRSEPKWSDKHTIYRCDGPATQKLDRYGTWQRARALVMV